MSSFYVECIGAEKFQNAEIRDKTCRIVPANAKHERNPAAV